MAKPEKAGSDPVVTLIKVIRPFKNYSPGDITRLSPAEAELVFKKALAEAVAEPDLE